MQPTRTRLRRAVPEDSAELIRLRRVLLAGSGAYYASSDPDEHRQWQERFVRWLPEASRSPNIFVAVADRSDASLAACGIAMIDARPPGPGLINGRSGWIQSMVTDPRYRGEGYASAILTLLLDWFRDSEISRVILHTTGEGQSLYLRHGFEACGENALVARLDRGHATIQQT